MVSNTQVLHGPDLILPRITSVSPPTILHSIFSPLLQQGEHELVLTRVPNQLSYSRDECHHNLALHIYNPLLISEVQIQKAIVFNPVWGLTYCSELVGLIGQWWLYLTDIRRGGYTLNT